MAIFQYCPYETEQSCPYCKTSKYNIKECVALHCPHDEKEEEEKQK